MKLTHKLRDVNAYECFASCNLKSDQKNGQYFNKIERSKKRKKKENRQNKFTKQQPYNTLMRK